MLIINTNPYIGVLSVKKREKGKSISCPLLSISIKFVVEIICRGECYPKVQLLLCKAQRVAGMPKSYGLCGYDNKRCLMNEKIFQEYCHV